MQTVFPFNWHKNTDWHKNLAGFTLMELLVALLLTTLLSVTVAGHLGVSQKLRLQMHQEALAAAVAEDLALQLAKGSSPPGSLTVSLQSSLCTSTHPQAAFDLSLVCQASQKLRGLDVRRQGQEIRLSWQSLYGVRELVRPAH